MVYIAIAIALASICTSGLSIYWAKEAERINEKIRELDRRDGEL